MAFGLGAIELVSSMVSVHHTDRWGKERCVVLGSVAMLAGVLVLAAGAAHLTLVLGGIGVFVVGFELAIISGMPLGAGAHARCAGARPLHDDLRRPTTLCSWPSLRPHGRDARIAWPAIGAAVLTVAAAVLISIRHRRIIGHALPVGAATS